MKWALYLASTWLTIERNAENAVIQFDVRQDLNKTIAETDEGEKTTTVANRLIIQETSMQ